MNNRYTLFGFELSPYSIKVRSYLIYKKISFEWKDRNINNNKEFLKLSKVPLIPLLYDQTKNKSYQDSSLIIKTLENKYPDSSIIPQEDDLKFISLLLEEYADEWLNKSMFHYRWSYKKDQKQASEKIATLLIPNIFKNSSFFSNLIIKLTSGKIKKRMISRKHFVGSSEKNSKIIENSYLNFIRLLSNHLKSRSYILGNRPSLADFAIWGQMYNLWRDPTPGSFIYTKYPELIKWLELMRNPKQLGDFENLQTLIPTLAPILKEEISDIFLPWADANQNSIENRIDNFNLIIKNQVFTQKSMKFQSKSFTNLKSEYHSCFVSDTLSSLLDEFEISKFLDK